MSKVISDTKICLAALLILAILIGGNFFIKGFSSPINFNNAVGKAAPEFSLEDINAKTIKLSDLRGKNVILFFNEGAMCYPSCWNQMLELAKDSRLNNEKTASFSIVIDTKEEWERITKQMPEFSQTKILFDTTKKVSTDYGVLTLPSSMHVGSMPGHSYVIIDKNGILRYVFDDPNMGIRNDMLSAEVTKLI
ncbi:TPA: redoxin domain-containing protein [archaeon]|uniref:Redoxin domain-containing protein n=1 Tax=Candidatus Naiadarchaeum limnaeum TaxID=2756139 RepID=A0A832V192_9ARCH|nr:redoxin domain-containing protein [Candidatus Naiadarchaeum limnaeum]